MTMTIHPLRRDVHAHEERNEDAVEENERGKQKRDMTASSELQHDDQMGLHAIKKYNSALLLLTLSGDHLPAETSTALALP